jgi:F0F1-type ATP synthase assembly protein I
VKNLFRSNSRKKPKPSDTGYLQYTTIAYQLIATISLGILAGYLLDRLTGWSFPVFKVVCSFGAVLVALYIVFKRLMKNKE